MNDSVHVLIAESVVQTHGTGKDYGTRKTYPTGWLRASRRRWAAECRLAPDFMCEGIGATTWHVLKGWHRQKTRALLAVVWTLLPHTLASGPIRCARRSVSAQFLPSGSSPSLPSWNLAIGPVGRRCMRLLHACSG